MTSKFALIALMLSGCTPGEQIWLLQVTYGPEPTCASVVTHNVTGAYEPADGVGDWLEDALSDRSDALSFAQISFLDHEIATMVIGTEVWPGVLQEDGAWAFAWTGWVDERTSREHERGYRYTEQVTAEAVEEIRLNLDTKAGTGTWSVSHTSTVAYTESDQWDEAAGLFEGEIPIDAWLVTDQGPAGAVPVVNDYDTAECAEVTCTLTVATTCEEQHDVTATRTGYTSEEAFEHLQDATQPAGTP